MTLDTEYSRNYSNKEYFTPVKKLSLNYDDDVRDFTRSQIEYFIYNITDETFVTNFNFTTLEPTTEYHHIVIPKAPDNVFESGLIIPLYVGIFILSVVGNSLVLVTLAQNKRMRTVTNVYLLNLVSIALGLHSVKGALAIRIQGGLWLTL